MTCNGTRKLFFVFFFLGGGRGQDVNCGTWDCFGGLAYSAERGKILGRDVEGTKEAWVRRGSWQDAAAHA